MPFEIGHRNSIGGLEKDGEMLLPADVGVLSQKSCGGTNACLFEGKRPSSIAFEKSLIRNLNACSRRKRKRKEKTRAVGLSFVLCLLSCYYRVCWSIVCFCDLVFPSKKQDGLSALSRLRIHNRRDNDVCMCVLSTPSVFQIATQTLEQLLLTVSFDMMKCSALRTQICDSGRIYLSSKLRTPACSVGEK